MKALLARLGGTPGKYTIYVHIYVSVFVLVFCNEPAESTVIATRVDHACQVRGQKKLRMTKNIDLKTSVHD